MSGGSPPKPWERPGGAGGTSAMPGATTTIAADPTGSAAAPPLPTKPDSLSALATRNASAYSSPYNRPSPYSSGYGSAYSSPYGGYGAGAGAYSSPYSRFGGGGYGSMYSSPMGYGGGFGGAGGMYGQPGMYGPNGQEQTLTNQFGQSTQATFQMIESIVGAFGGFAQMLESTYMATHSSFFAMVSVAEQFGTLKQTLGSVLGIFAIMRWLRVGLAKLTGRPPPAETADLTAANFAAFSGGAAAGSGGRPAPDGKPSRPSRKPFIFFVVAVFGLPYLMSKLIRALAENQERQQQRQLEEQQPIDPNKLDFCRVLYDYVPQMGPGQQFQDGIDLEVKKGDYVAILSKADLMGQPSEWWRCRARNGHIGYLPSPYLETIQRRPPQAQIAATAASNTSSPVSSRVNTMTSTKFGADSRANSLKEKPELLPAKTKPQMPDSKPNDISVESFQRAGFYS